MGKWILYHGSPVIVYKPEYGKGRPYNDYGSGFYCTQSLEMAKEWACTQGMDGFANEYEIETDGLKILNLTEKEYTVLHWLTILISHRIFRLSTPVMVRADAWLKENYYIDVDAYDAVIGYRADDSYFSFARSFLSNEISLEQLSRAMKLGKLGEQFVLKSEEAFQRIHFVKYYAADNSVYYVQRKARDEAARKAFHSERDIWNPEGIFIQDLIRGEVRPDDARIQ